MSDYPNETVQDAANKLIAALALHEDARGTVTDALHDMWDAGREHAAGPQAANLLRAIRTDAEAVRSGRALTRAVPAARIIGHVEQLLAMLGDTDPTGTRQRGEFSYASLLDAAGITTHDDELHRFLAAALARAQDLLTNTTDPTRRAQIEHWITQARAAQGARDAAEIRRLLATPYVQTGGQS